MVISSRWDLDEINLGEGIEIALTALHADRLALRCGAGFIDADPSNLPNAEQLASEAKCKHMGIDESPQIDRPEFATLEQVFSLLLNAGGQWQTKSSGSAIRGGRAGAVRRR
jgi:hypothetical protein